MRDVIDVIGNGLSFVQGKDASAVITFLVVIMALSHLKMILQLWEQMLLQPRPLKQRKKSR